MIRRLDRFWTARVAGVTDQVFCDALRRLGVGVETGVFGARMAVELVNDGPATIVLGP